VPQFVPNSGTFLITPAHVAVESFPFDKRMATPSAMTEASVSRRGSVCNRGGTGGTVYRFEVLDLPLKLTNASCIPLGAKAGEFLPFLVEHLLQFRALRTPSHTSLHGARSTASPHAEMKAAGLSSCAVSVPPGVWGVPLRNYAYAPPACYWQPGYWVNKPYGDGWGRFTYVQQWIPA
jgi:hypothetical protein